MRKVAVLAVMLMAALAVMAGKAMPAYGADRPGDSAVAVGTDGRSSQVIFADGFVVSSDDEQADVDEVAACDDEDADVDEVAACKYVKSEFTSEKSASGWLGVRVSPVPPDLAAQLDLDDVGAMVVNVVRGSPAQKAGLRRYDVIVSAGKGEEIKGAESLIEVVRSHRPGQQLRLGIIRGGKNRQVTVRLGEPIPPEKARYVYEETPGRQWQDVYKLHGGIIRKGPHGMVFISPGGEMDIPPQLLKELAKRPWPNVQITVGGKVSDGRQSIKVSRTEDGKMLVVEKSADGSFVVRREGLGGKGSVEHHYRSLDELKRKDRKAYDFYRSVQVNGVIGRMRMGMPPCGGKVVESPGNRNGEAGGEEEGQEAERARKLLEAQHRRLAEQIRRMAEHAARMHRPGGRGPGETSRQTAPPPKREFSVDENGRITVELRQGDSVLRMTFRNANELAKKKPDLYKYYRSAMKELE
ncbi:MAG: PDZ domain-containing protein [Planctomycetes bacterium]|nr:PDZ domain-containing protein [Planctomycetota bacterium]